MAPAYLSGTIRGVKRVLANTVHTVIYCLIFVITHVPTYHSVWFNTMTQPLAEDTPINSAHPFY